MSASPDDSRIPGFYGRLTRTDAEKALKDHGALDGQYLIRICPLTGKYSISLSSKGSIFHYLVKVSPDGLMSLSDGRNFSRFKDLIEYYGLMADGIETTLSTPCPKKVTLATMKAKQGGTSLGGLSFDGTPSAKLRSSFGSSSAPNTPHRSSFSSENYLWYHGRISRQDAEEILNELETGDEITLKVCI